jgi:hypothetical protein
MRPRGVIRTGSFPAGDEAHGRSAGSHSDPYCHYSGNDEQNTDADCRSFDSMRPRQVEVSLGCVANSSASGQVLTHEKGSPLSGHVRFQGSTEIQISTARLSLVTERCLPQLDITAYFQSFINYLIQ